MSARVVVRLLQRGGLRDALAAVLHGQGGDDTRGRADKPSGQRGRGLEGDTCSHERLGHAAAQLAAGLRQDNVGLHRRALGVSEATGLHDGSVGPPALAAVLI
jgi:hypothetical protein